MKVFNSLDEINNVEPTVTALGNFDGIHKGHRELISLAVAEARKAGLMSAVFTFSTHPRNAFGRNAVKNIISAEEKAQIIADLGVDYLFNLPFADEIRTLSPSEFIDRLLIEKFNMKEGFCGFNYTFGYKAEGTPEMLKAEGAEKGFKIHVLEPYTVDGEVVSSTLIRKIIEKGEVELCRKYMDRNFAAGGVATPADAALMMQLGAEGVFVGSGIFKSGDPKKRAAAIVKAVTNYTDQKMLAELSEDLGEAMVGINEQEIKLLMAERGK